MKDEEIRTRKGIEEKEKENELSPKQHT